MSSNNNNPSGTASRRDSKSKVSGPSNNAGNSLQRMGMNLPPNTMNVMPAGMRMMNLNMGGGFMQNAMGTINMPMNQAMMNVQQQQQQQQQTGMDQSIGQFPFAMKQQQQQQFQQQQQQFQQQLQGLMGTNQHMANINMAGLNPLAQPQPSQNNQRVNIMNLLTQQQAGKDVPQTGTQQQNQPMMQPSQMQQNQMKQSLMQQTQMQQSQQLHQQQQTQLQQTQMQQNQIQQNQMQQNQMQQNQMQQNQMQQNQMQQNQMQQSMMQHTQMQQKHVQQNQIQQSHMKQSQQQQQSLQAHLLQHQQQLLQLNLQRHQSDLQQDQSNSQNSLNALPPSAPPMIRWNTNMSAGMGNKQPPATSPVNYLQMAAAQAQAQNKFNDQLQQQQVQNGQQQVSQTNNQGIRTQSIRPPSALQTFDSRSVSNASMGQQHNDCQRRPSSNMSLGGTNITNHQQGNNQSQPSFNNNLSQAPIPNQLFLQQQLQLQQLQNLQGPSTRSASFSGALGPSPLQQQIQQAQNSMQHQSRRNSNSSVSSVGQKEQGSQSQSTRPSSQSQPASGSFAVMPNQQFFFQQQFPQIQNLQSLRSNSVSVGQQSQNLLSSNVQLGIMQSNQADQTQANTGASMQLPDQFFPQQQSQQLQNMLNQSRTPSGASASPLQQTGQNQSRRPSSQLHALSGGASMPMTNQQLFLQQQMQQFQNLQKQSQTPSSASLSSPQKSQAQIQFRRPSSGVSEAAPPMPNQQLFLQQQLKQIQNAQKQSQPLPGTSSSPAPRGPRPSSSHSQISAGTSAQMFFLQQQQLQQLPNMQGTKQSQPSQYLLPDTGHQTIPQSTNQPGIKTSHTPYNDSAQLSGIADGANEKDSSAQLPRSTSTGQKRSESAGPNERRASYSQHTQVLVKQGAVELSSKASDGKTPTDAEPPTEEHQHQQVQAQAWFLLQQASSVPEEDGQNKSDVSETSKQIVSNESLKLSEQNEALRKMQEQFKQQEAIATLQQRQRGANDDELTLPVLSSRETSQLRRQSWSQSDQISQMGQNLGQQLPLEKKNPDGNFPKSPSVPNEHNLQQPASLMKFQGLGLQTLASMQPQTKLVRQEKFQSSSSTPAPVITVRVQSNQQQKTDIGMQSQFPPHQRQMPQDAMQQRLQLQNQAEFAKLQEIQQRMNQQYQRRPSQGKQEQIQRDALQLEDSATLQADHQRDQRPSSTQQQQQNKQDLLRQQMRMQFEFAQLQKQKRLQQHDQQRPIQPEQQFQQDYLQKQQQNQVDFGALQDQQHQRRPSQSQQQQNQQDELQHQQLQMQAPFAQLHDNQQANQRSISFNISQHKASQDDSVVNNNKLMKSSQSPHHQQHRPSLMQQHQPFANQQPTKQQHMQQQQQHQQGNIWPNCQNQQLQRFEQMMMQKNIGGVNAQPNAVTAKNAQTPINRPQVPTQNLNAPIQNFPNDQHRLSMMSPSSYLHPSSNNDTGLLNFYKPLSRAKSSERRSSGKSVEESTKFPTVLPVSEKALVRAANVVTIHPPQSIQRADIAASRASLQQTSQIVTSSLTTNPFDERKHKKTEISREDSAPSDSLVGAKTPSTEASKAGHTSREHHYTPQHVSSLTNEEVLEIATKLPVAERIVFSAKQLLGTGKNGFSRSTSAMQRLKRQRARQIGANGCDELDDEHMKKKTFNVRLAKKLHSEMKQGLMFCNMMTEVLKSIITEIDPDNPLLSIPMPTVFDPVSSETSGGEPNKLKDGITSGSAADHSDCTHSMENPFKNPPSVQAARSLGMGLNDGAETFAEGNPNGSTLRKRDCNSDDTPDPALLQMISDDDGKKLTKKEIGYRLFETTRYRTLEPGDFVAAKVSSQDLWILARVVKQWISPGLSYKHMKNMSEIKRDAIFGEKVYIQDHDEYNSDMKSARAVSRQDILPLPKSVSEANNWGSRARKGSRVYAMYPNTTALYAATVINNTTYCRNEDDIIVVEFDGDEDELGVTPMRHIPARFVTLMPRESPSFKKKLKTVTSGGGGKKRGSKLISSPTMGPSPSQFSDTSVDRMLLEMLK